MEKIEQNKIKQPKKNTWANFSKAVALSATLLAWVQSCDISLKEPIDINDWKQTEMTDGNKKSIEITAIDSRFEWFMDTKINKDEINFQIDASRDIDVYTYFLSKKEQLLNKRRYTKSESYDPWEYMSIAIGETFNLCIEPGYNDWWNYTDSFTFFITKRKNTDIYKNGSMYDAYNGFVIEEDKLNSMMFLKWMIAH